MYSLVLLPASLPTPKTGGIFFRMNMTNQTMLVTQSGLQQLKDELSQLVNSRRPQMVDRLSLARSMGDLSENSDYISAKEELAFIDGRIAEIEDILKNVKVVAPTNTNAVEMGNTVTIQINNSQVVFRIVGEWEADPSAKKISHSSPLGVALMGRKVGDKVEVDAPAGKLTYTIVAIS